jgi:hypothetical protein
VFENHHSAVRKEWEGIFGRSVYTMQKSKKQVVKHMRKNNYECKAYRRNGLNRPTSP